MSSENENLETLNDINIEDEIVKSDITSDGKEFHLRTMGQLKSKVKKNQEMRQNPALFGQDFSFICGVVEGFYGRPWTAEQRKELFRRMKNMGMNTYLYGPKDDYKHRMYWRDLYSVEEMELLRDLIKTAEENDVLFIYAISPGLDMVFGANKEIDALKNKLFQVRDLGCKAFALLFDDIDPSLCVSDLERYKSSAIAQASITNQMFKVLDMPRFLFCPTEYCSSMANPDVQSSAYLQALGNELHPDISVMWTGPKVVSKYISVESIVELKRVLKRKILIWDNIHANDYDPKRMFLGPYKGRSTELIPHLSGVLTNPNCEFECNYIAMHTLVTWWKCHQPRASEQWKNENDDNFKDVDVDDTVLSTETEDITIKPVEVDVTKDDNNENKEEITNVADQDIENKDVVDDDIEVKSKSSSMSTSSSTTTNSSQDSDYSSHGSRMSINEIPFNHGSYDPDKALSLAISEWSVMFALTRAATIPKKVVMSGPPLLSDTPMITKTVVCSQLTMTSCTNVLSLQPVPSTMESKPVGESSTEDIKQQPPDDDKNERRVVANVVATNDSEGDVVMTTPDRPTVESSLKPMNVDTSEKASDVEMKDEEEMVLDETNKYSNSSLKSGSTTPHMEVEDIDNEDVPMGTLLNKEGGDLHETATLQNQPAKVVNLCDISNEEIKLLIELFYLPYEHGSIGLSMVENFKWLKNNINKAVTSTNLKDDKSLDKALQWTERAIKFEEQCVEVRNMCNKIVSCPNRFLVYDFFPYIWDMKGIVSMLSSFIKWLGQFYLRNRVKTLHKTLSETSPEPRPIEPIPDLSNPALSWLGPDPEPWVFRGGLSGEFQRLLPLSSLNDLFYQPLPRDPITTTYIVRPYTPSDEKCVYRICRERYEDDLALDVFTKFPDLPGEKLVGAFLTFTPEYCFVVENGEGICGYLVGCSDAKEFWKKYQIAYLPDLQEKYPKFIDTDDYSNPIIEKLIQEIHCEKDRYEYADEALHKTHPSLMHFALRKYVVDNSVAKSMTVCQLSALKSCDSVGVHTVVKINDGHLQEVYASLGLQEIRGIADEVPVETGAVDYVVLGRTF